MRIQLILQVADPVDEVLSTAESFVTVVRLFNPERRQDAPQRFVLEGKGLGLMPGDRFMLTLDKLGAS